MIHAKITESPLCAGKEYCFNLNGNELYNAEVLKAEGCWATLKVTKIYDSRFKENYKEGQVFDIRVSNYKFSEIKKS